jgi:copper(I)-binding protein
VTRWTRRLLVGAIAILVPALAGCEAGYNAPTLSFHPASNGVSIVANGIDIDNAFVLGPALTSPPLPVGGQAGVFLSLSAQDNNDRLVSASAPGAARSVQLVTGPVTLNQGTLVDLSGPHPLIVLNGLTSPLSGGETVHLVLTFATAGAVALEIPVFPAAYDYATYFPPLAPTASTAAHRHKAKARVKVTADLSASPTASATP